MILEGSGNIFDVCMNGDGIIIDELGIKSEFLNIDLLKSLTLEIDSLIETLVIEQQDTNNDEVYDELIDEIKNKKTEYDFEFISSNNEKRVYLL